MRTTIWALLSAAVAVPVSAQQPSQAAIAGEWTYNAADSDKAREFMPRMGADSGGRPAQRPAGPPPGGKPGGGGRGGGGSGPPGGGFGPPGGAGGRGPGGSPMNEKVRARMRQTMQLALAAPRTLRISLADSMLWIGRDSVAEPLRLKMDGKKNKLEPAGDGEGEVEVRARLREGALGAEWSVKGGGKFEESYFLTSDRRQLVVLLELEMGGGGEPVRFRRLYDRAAQAVAPLTPSP